MISSSTVSNLMAGSFLGDPPPPPKVVYSTGGIYFWTGLETYISSSESSL
jgi:hypothetical protein